MRHGLYCKTRIDESAPTIFTVTLQGLNNFLCKQIKLASLAICKRKNLQASVHLHCNLEAFLQYKNRHCQLFS